MRVYVHRTARQSRNRIKMQIVYKFAHGDMFIGADFEIESIKDYASHLNFIRLARDAAGEG
jgi:hypothetical protein